MLINPQLPVNHFHIRDGGFLPGIHGLVFDGDKGRLWLRGRRWIGRVIGASRQHNANDSEYSHTFSNKDGAAILVRRERKVHPGQKLY